MNSRTSNRVRGTTWAFAVLALILFCWLGFAIAKLSTIFQGLRMPLPIAARLVMTYGPVGLPVLGGTAAALILLSDLFRPRRWLPLQLTSICLLLWILLAQSAFRSRIVLAVPSSTLSTNHEFLSNDSKKLQ